MNIYKIHQINLDNIYFSELIQGDDKNLILLKYYDSNKKKKVPFTIQTCSLLFENKINKLSNNDGRTHQLEIPLFSNDNHKVLELQKFLKKLDEKIQKFIVKNGQQLNIVDSIMYKPIIRDSIEDNEKLQNGVLKLDIIKTKKFQTRIFNEERKLVSTDYLEDNICYIKFLLEFPALWFSKNRCGLTIRPCQLSVQVDNTLTDTYNFIPSDNEYDDIFVQDTEVIPKKDVIKNSETSDFNEIIINNDNNNEIVVSNTSIDIDNNIDVNNKDNNDVDNNENNNDVNNNEVDNNEVDNNEVDNNEVDNNDVDNNEDNNDVDNNEESDSDEYDEESDDEGDEDNIKIISNTTSEISFDENLSDSDIDTKLNHLLNSFSENK